MPQNQRNRQSQQTTGENRTLQTIVQATRLLLTGISAPTSGW